MSSRPQRNAWLKFAATIALLILLLWRTDVPAIGAALRELTLANWLINVGLFLAAWIIAAAKWKVLLPGERFQTLVKLNFVGQYYGTLLPGHIAGEAMKAYRLGKGRVDAEQVAASVLIDRITGLIGLLLVAVVGISLNTGSNRVRILVTLCGAVLLLTLALFSFRLPWWSSLVAALEKRRGPAARIGGQIRRALAACQDYLKGPALLLVSIAIGALFQIVAVWINYRIGRELGLQVAFGDWCWIFGVVSIAVALPITIGGIGLREGSFVGALAMLGVTSERALAVSFAIFSLALVGAAIGATLEWSRRGSLRYR